ncbi:MAG TPA: peptidoglycan DD-metalloendopeptidase family protein [Gemmatimonadales bacterium]|nr:peptidoglycan DD-metalloendopeptidase family protein [Gemmatimonadales bacterium]
MRRLRLLLAILVVAGAAAAARSHHWPWPRLSDRRPALAAASVLPTGPTQRAFIETLDTLRRGETFGALLNRHRITGLDLSQFGAANALDPKRLRPGLVFAIGRTRVDTDPSRIQVQVSPERLVTFVRSDTGWEAAAQEVPWTGKTVRLEGQIDNSLYEALDAQVPDDQFDAGNRVRLAWALADVFAWQVDFTRDIQPGDRYVVLCERLVSPDGQTRLGRIIASDLVISGKRLTAIRFDSAGPSAYFDADGNSLRRAFLRAPVEFRRVSSNFARARFHPILGTWRRHEGTDYSAAPGTPVMAAGDGVVLRAGYGGGYGNLIEIRHRNGITTRYGHLRGFARGIHAGARVSQGQVIGFVGSTGLATGPHLHYEFRVNGVAQDSRRVNLGTGAAVAAALRPAFERERDRVLGLLRPQMVAIQ